MKTIEITVSSTGEVTVQTKGYSGAECIGASDFIEKALGVVGTKERTAEYYKQPATQQQEVKQ